MDWKLFSVVPAIMLCVLFVVLIYGVIRAWKTNNKFIAFVYFALSIAAAITFYAFYGKELFGL